MTQFEFRPPSDEFLDWKRDYKRHEPSRQAWRSCGCMLLSFVVWAVVLLTAFLWG